MKSLTPDSQGLGNTNDTRTSMTGWEIYETSPSFYEDWDSEYAFRNREDTTFDVSVIMKDTDLQDDPQASSWSATIAGIKMSELNESLIGLNEGTLNITLGTADANAIGLWLQKSNSFENDSTGKIDIDIDSYEGDPALSSVTTVKSGIKLESNASFENSGYIHANVAGGENGTTYVFNSFVSGSESEQSIFTNKGTVEFDANSRRKALNASTVYAVRVGANDIFDNQGTFSGTIHSYGGTGRVLEIYNSTTPQSFRNTGTFDVTVNANALEDADSLAMAEGIYLNDGELIENRGTIKLDLNVISNSLTTVGDSYGPQLNSHPNSGGHYKNYGTTSISVSNDSAAKGTVYGVISNADSIFYNASGAQFTVDVSGYYGAGIDHRSTEDLINDGTLTITATSSALDKPSNMRGIYAENGANVINNGSMDIDTYGNVTRGINIRNGGTFTNTGEVDVTVTHRETDTSPMGGTALLFEKNANLVNSGTIEIIGTGNGHLPSPTSVAKLLWAKDRMEILKEKSPRNHQGSGAFKSELN